MPKLTLRQLEAAARKKNRIIVLDKMGRTQKGIALQLKCSQQYVSKVLRKEKEKAACN